MLKHSIFFYPLFGLGYISVAVFFFITGYGLAQQYKSKGAEYIKYFPRNRILPFYVKYVILVLLYTAFYTLFQNPGIEVTTDSVIRSFLFGGTIVSKGWYLQASLIIYLSFFIIFRTIKSRRCLWIVLAALIYSIVCIVLELPTTWYECALLPLFGGVCGSLDLKPQKSWIGILLTGLLFCRLFILGIRAFYGEPIRIFCKMLSAVVFVWLVISLVHKNLCPMHKVFCWLGSVSFEIYVLQGMIMEFFEYELRIDNNFIYCVTVVAVTIILSILTHPAFTAIDKKMKKSRIS